MKTAHNPNKPALNIDRVAAAMNRYLVPAAQAQPKRKEDSKPA
jgi:hypothetical protein